MMCLSYIYVSLSLPPLLLFSLKSIEKIFLVRIKKYFIIARTCNMRSTLLTHVSVRYSLADHRPRVV